MAETLGIIENSDDLRVCTHHRRMIGVRPLKLFIAGMTFEQLVDGPLALLRIAHFIGARRDRQSED